MEVGIGGNDPGFAAHHLIELTISDGFSVEARQNEESVGDSFHMAHTHRSGSGIRGVVKQEQHYERGEVSWPATSGHIGEMAISPTECPVAERRNELSVLPAPKPYQLSIRSRFFGRKLMHNASSLTARRSRLSTTRYRSGGK